MSKPLLNVENLKTYFFLVSGTARAVDGVSFTIDAGETLGIVGESGSGKSVTSKSIVRLLEKVGRIVDGKIEFEGKDVLALSEKELLAYRGRDVGMIFQNPMTSLDPVFTVGHQMGEPARPSPDLQGRGQKDQHRCAARRGHSGAGSPLQRLSL